MLTQLSKEIHENAVAHGFWEDIDIETKFALIHAELGEAMAEYQHGRPMWYYETEWDEKCQYCKEQPDMFSEECTECIDCPELKKPEGIAIELIDAVIRALDVIGHYGQEVTSATPVMRKEDSLSFLVNIVHAYVCEAYRKCIVYGATSELMQRKNTDAGFFTNTLSIAVQYILRWLEVQGVNWQKLMRIKMDYNKTRPYMHGKRC